VYLSRLRNYRRQTQVFHKKVGHVLIKLTSLALQSSSATSTADYACFGPDTDLHASLSPLNSFVLLYGFHSVLLSQKLSSVVISYQQ
jgi:hypothetical protein